MRNDSFLNNDGSAVRPGRCKRALVALLDITANTYPEQGVITTLGYYKRTAWVNANILTFFRDDGPLGGFRVFSVDVLRKHLSKAEALDKKIYVRGHSNDTTGADQEFQPAWTNVFFDLFHASANTETRGQRNSRQRRNLHTVSQTLIGAQAPLGYVGPGPAELREETSQNDGAQEMRSRHIGNFVVERVEVVGGDDPEEVGEDVPGVGDLVQRRPAPRRLAAGRGHGHG